MKTFVLITVVLFWFHDAMVLTETEDSVGTEDSADREDEDGLTDAPRSSKEDVGEGYSPDTIPPRLLKRKYPAFHPETFMRDSDDEDGLTNTPSSTEEDVGEGPTHTDTNPRLLKERKYTTKNTDGFMKLKKMKKERAKWFIDEPYDVADYSM